MSDSAEHRVVERWPTEEGRAPSLDGERVIWGVVVAVMLLDVATTAIGLQYGLHEGNAIVGAVIARFGIPGLFLLKAVVLALAATLAFTLPDRVSSVVPLGLALPTTVAVATNLALVGML